MNYTIVSLSANLEQDGQTPLHLVSAQGKETFIPILASSKHYSLDTNIRDIVSDAAFDKISMQEWETE